jgi:hypothetical protein
MVAKIPRAVGSECVMKTSSFVQSRSTFSPRSACSISGTC